jgi:hypothetical protein
MDEFAKLEFSRGREEREREDDKAGVMDEFAKA